MVQAILNQAIQEKRKTPLLQVSQGSKRFGGKRVLTEIDREVAEYELVVVVGRSGCLTPRASSLTLSQDALAKNQRKSHRGLDNIGFLGARILLYHVEHYLPDP